MYMYHGTWKTIPTKKEFLIGSENSYKKDLIKSSYMESSFCNQGTDNLTLNQKIAHANVAINQPIDKIIHWDFYSELMKYVVWITKLKTKWVNKKRCANRTIDFSYLSLKDRKLDLKTICKLAHIESFPDKYCSTQNHTNCVMKKQNFIFETKVVWKHHQSWGWICHTELPFGFEHPIILSGKHMIFK